MNQNEIEVKNKMVNIISSILKTYAIGYVVKENSKIRKRKLRDNIKLISNGK